MTTAGHVPTEDGAVLLRPSAEELPPLLSATRKVLADINFLIAGLPAEQLREQGRAELVESLGLRSDRPWIVTAHQSRMHHAGVWFKDTVAAALAEATGGEALHVVADLDTLDNCELSVPQIGPDGLLSATSAPFAQLAERRCPAQLPPPSPETLEELIRLVEHSGLPADVFAFWSGPARSVLAGARTLAEWITAARTGVNDALGVRITHEFWSKIARRRAFARFVADIALRYRRMHEAYGQALSAYRANHGITDPLQPVPALGRRGGALELPLWAYRQSGPREPVFARHCAGSVQLLTPAGPLVRLGATDEAATDAISHLSASDVTLAPRALTLTMFLRAFIADVFIHGTGGAEYDRLGDALTELWFGWRCPAFVTASATLRLPCPMVPTTQADLARACWHVHHAWHNPHLYAKPGHQSAQVKSLLARKDKLLDEIASAPRFSGGRSAAFAELHRTKAQLRSLLPQAQDSTTERVRTVRRQLAHNHLAQSREAFFAMMPREKLLGLIEQARAWANSVR